MIKIGKMMKTLVACGMVLSLALGMVGCKKSGQSALDRIKQSGKLVLGTCADYPPYEFHKTTNGNDEIIGFDVEIAKAIADELGVKLEIKDMKFDGLLPALKTNNIDLIVAGMNITPERQKQVDFSKLYYTAKQAVVVRKEDKDKFDSLEALSGKKIGVQKSSTQETIAKDSIKDAQLTSLGKVTDLMLEVKNKKVDGILVVDEVAKAYVNKNDDLAIAGAVFKDADDSSAIAVNKGNGDLIDVINKVIDKLNSQNKITDWVTQYNDVAQQD
ncbi:MAG: transporter substrate-binding domain-containing protein [Bacillota bacterium]|nr:transporter substrate-binding domain-containing protein [Bacillota bacterium]